MISLKRHLKLSDHRFYDTSTLHGVGPRSSKNNNSLSQDSSDMKSCSVYQFDGIIYLAQIAYLSMRIKPADALSYLIRFKMKSLL